MEFEITCPIDGPIKVSLEDIDTVVLREPQSAEITFICPQCGEQITVQAIIPPFLVEAINALSESGELPEDSPLHDMADLISELHEQMRADTIEGFELAMDEDETEAVPVSAEQTVLALDDETTEAYCEYFRRQLEHVGSVDEILAEIDAGHA